MGQAPVIKLAQLTAENRKRLFDLLKLPSPSEKITDRAASKFKTFDEQWGKGRERWEKWLKEKRKEREK